jgi:hypothetical protein
MFEPFAQKADIMARRSIFQAPFAAMLIALASILIISSGTEMTAQAAQGSAIASTTISPSPISSLGLGHVA